MTTAVSVVLTVESADAVEEHLVITYADPLFHVRDIERDSRTQRDALSVVGHLRTILEHAGTAFIAIVDHEEHALNIGFLARRQSTQWNDVTCAEQPRPILWQDVEAELWAGLTRLMHAGANTSIPVSGQETKQAS